MTARRSPRVLWAVVALLAAPGLIAAAGAVSYHAANRSTHSLVSGGVRREYSLHLPPRYDDGDAMPLVISMHPAALWPAAQMMITRWNAVADSVRAIVVYPSAPTKGGPNIWRAAGGPSTEAEVRFISELIDTLSSRYRIDASRIYADGFSNGGGMAFVASCALSHRIAAVGMVAPALLLPFRWCRDTTPVPMMQIHGTHDNAVPYRGGTSWVTRSPFPNVRSWVASWAARNRCGATPVDSLVAKHVIRRSYSGCARGGDVVLYTIDGGGHTWPGGTPLAEWFVGRTSTEIDATRELWRFFSSHPMTIRGTK